MSRLDPVDVDASDVKNSLDVKLLVASLTHHGGSLLEALIEEHVNLIATGLEPATLVDLGPSVTDVLQR